MDMYKSAYESDPRNIENQPGPVVPGLRIVVTTSHYLKSFKYHKNDKRARTRC